MTTPPPQGRTIVVVGATGLQGSAVTHRLLQEGWRVRALTRSAQGAKARALAEAGAEVIQANTENPATLPHAFEGAYGVYNVQNTLLNGVEREIQQGKNVADAARQAGIRHLVYGSAGTGARDTGIPSWDSKLVIQDYMASLGLPLTVLRPMAFMEIMTDPKFFPQMAAWHVMPALMGADRPVVWFSAADLGHIVARVLAEPERFIGQDIRLLSDVRTLNDCRALYAEVLGRQPPRFPLPPFIFERFGIVGQDLGRMWRWLRTADLDQNTQPTLSIYPQAFTVETWLKTQRT